MGAICIYPSKISRLVTYAHNHDRRPCKRWDTPEKSPIRRLLSRGKTSPFHNFWHFFPLRSDRHTPPPIGHLRRIRVFIPMASAPMRRTSHPSGSRPRDVWLLSQTSAPGIVDAPENPRFPTVSNRVQRTDSMAPSRVQL